jgi:hypothetical protein
MYKIKTARRDKDTEKVHCEVEGKPDIIFLDVRAGLVWPYRTQPGYWLILGQRDEQDALGKYPLVLLDEGESRNLSILFGSLTDSAVRLLCEDAYVDMSEENDCYRHAFSRYCDEGNIKRVFMVSAPYVDNFDYGTGLIREYVKDEALSWGKSRRVSWKKTKFPDTLRYMPCVLSWPLL